MDMDSKKGSFLCSSRFSLAFICFLGMTSQYSQRVNMSIAMVCMINQTALTEERTSDSQVNETMGYKNICSKPMTNNTEFQNEDGEFTWSKSTQGLILSAFVGGYVITHLPGGFLSTKFGGKRLFALCMLSTGVTTCLVPVAARVSSELLIAIRVINGMCEGVGWPAIYALWIYWAPPLERSKLIGFSFAGGNLGNAVTYPVSGLLCEYGFDGGWPAIFYLTGGISVLGSFAWMALVYDTPEQHPRISIEEKMYIQKSLQGQSGKTIEQKTSYPWKSIVTSSAVWAVMVSHICGVWMYTSFIATLPTYLKEVLNFDIKVNGLVTAIPYVGIWACAVVAGIVADKLRSEGIMTTTNVRKIINVAGMILPSILIIGAGYVDCTNWIVAATLVVLAVSLQGISFGAGYLVNHADIAPKYSSVLFSICNMTAHIVAFFAPYVIGIITTNQSPEEWKTAFVMTAAITSFGCVFYLIFGSGEQQPWAMDKETNVVDIFVTKL